MPITWKRTREKTAVCEHPSFNGHTTTCLVMRHRHRLVDNVSDGGKLRHADRILLLTVRQQGALHGVLDFLLLGANDLTLLLWLHHENGNKQTIYAHYKPKKRGNVSRKHTMNKQRDNHTSASVSHILVRLTKVSHEHRDERCEVQQQRTSTTANWRVAPLNSDAGEPSASFLASAASSNATKA